MSTKDEIEQFPYYKKKADKERRLILEKSVQNIRSNKNDTIIQNYKNKIEKDPLFLPNDTEIIKYIEDNYGKFETEIKNKNPEKGMDYELNLSDVFSVNPDFNKKEKICNIATNFIPNPGFSLDKLISTTIYYLTKSWLTRADSKYKLDIESFKNQIGKDTLRTDIYINNKKFVVDGNGQDTDTIAYTKIADDFNIELMSEMTKNNINIKQNIISLIDFCVCQNLFNFCNGIIQEFIRQKILPEMASVTKNKKDIQIFLKNKEQFLILNFSSDLIISYNESLDPEFTCGNLTFSLKILLNEDTFSLDNFILNYNVNDCIPPEMRPSNSGSFGKEASNFVNNNKGALATGALALGLGATVGTLFLTGVLGGKSKKYKKFNKFTIKKVKKLKKTKKNKHIKKYTRNKNKKNGFTKKSKKGH